MRRGTFAGLPEGRVDRRSTASGCRITYVGGDGNDVVLTVVNDAPTISAIGRRSVTENTPLGPIAFTVGDSDDDAAGAHRHRDVVESRARADANLIGSAARRGAHDRDHADVGCDGDTTITVTVSATARQTAQRRSRCR